MYRRTSRTHAACSARCTPATPAGRATPPARPPADPPVRPPADPLIPPPADPLIPPPADPLIRPRPVRSIHLDLSGWGRSRYRPGRRRGLIGARELTFHTAFAQDCDISRQYRRGGVPASTGQV